MSDIVSVEAIAGKIYLIRGLKVMLDRDLAELYVPEDFMFELTQEELKNWRSQFATSNQYIMGLRIPPFAFTEHGVLMLFSERFQIVFETLDQLLTVDVNKKKKIGFTVKEKVSKYGKKIF
jgi:hypothetical protein